MLCAKHCSLFCSSLNILQGAIKIVNALETATVLIPNKNKTQITKLIFHTHARNAIKLIVYDFILSFLIFMSLLHRHRISLAHRLIVDLISHPRCNLGVLINEPQEFIFILASSVIAPLNFPKLSTFYFPENHVYLHLCGGVSAYLGAAVQHQKEWGQSDWRVVRQKET